MTDSARRDSDRGGFVEPAELENLLAELVAIPSHAGAPGREDKAAACIAERFEREGIEAWLERTREGRTNVLARMSGGEDGPSLLLTGHTDTVPPYDMRNPYLLSHEGGYLRGRGSLDMKGALAAMMCAMFALRRSGAAFSGELWFAGVADEEEGSAGTRALVESGRRWDGAVVGEPSRLEICVAHRGLEWISFAFKGKAAHSSRLEEGVDAIGMALRFLLALDEEIRPAAAARRHAWAGPETVNVGLVRGGTQPSTVAADCEVQLDYRWIPGRSWPEVEAEFRGVIDSLAALIPGFDCRMSIVAASEMPEPWRHEAMEIDPRHGLVVAAEEALIAAGVSAPRLTSFPAWSDAGLLSTYGKTPCIVLGPGDIESAHSERECLAMSELWRAVSVYEELAQLFCAKDRIHG